MSSKFVTIKNIFAHVFYNYTSIEHRNSVEDCSNYVNDKKIMKIMNL